MFKPYYNKKKFIVILSGAFLCMTLLMVVLALALGGGNRYEDAEANQDSVSESEPEGTERLPDEVTGDEESDGGGTERLPDEVEEEGESPSQPPEETTAPPEEQPAEPVFYNVPDDMRAVQLVAGEDFLTGDDHSRAAVAAQIDKALSDAKGLTMNTVILDTKYKNQVLFTTGALSQADVELDCTDYFVTQARAAGFYVYLTYDVSDMMHADGSYYRAVSADGDTLDELHDNIAAFAEKYKPDGILLNNYYAQADGQSYQGYLSRGGGVGYEAYLRRVPEALLTQAAAAVRSAAPGVQVGLLADAVWENAANEQEGSETKASFTALGDGNADTRGLVLKQLFDFVMVKNFGSTIDGEAPFGAVAQWWSSLAGENGTRLYMMHASDRVGMQAPGWTVYEQLTKQVIDQSKISGISGSAFNSLSALLKNPGNSTTTLIKYMNDEINEQYVLTQLALQKPAQTTFQTQEPTVTFQGASDPQVEVTINGEKIETNDSGYFTVRKELKAGLNTFAVSHKDKTITYNITRVVEVIKEVSPVGSISVEGGTKVSVSALCYEGANVSASIGGQTIQMTLSDTDDDEIDKDSSYRLYTGVFTAPGASASPTSMGTITVTASAQGTTKTLQGASVTVNKLAQMGTGAVVQVVADAAETFPVTTLNDNSNPNNYPLPAGTLDMTVGDEIVYKSGKETFQYWKLQSGVRVYSSDIKAVGSGLPDNNKITKMGIKSSAQFTTVTLATQQKVPFTVAYDGASLVFKFHYTGSVPSSASLKDNALFTSAQWSGSDLTLKLRRSGGFLGYKAYYDDSGNLVLRFNNSPGSLSGARIVVDPGHGGNDPGASGFYPGKDEREINLAVAQSLAAELKGRGASVLTLTPGTTMASRLTAARAFNPQVLVSIHCNSSETNASASGTEVYYYYPFQKALATNVAAGISSSFGSTNRGAKSGLYYMTRESQFACVLAEIGFVSNESEYTKLINTKYQARIAQGVANGIAAYLGATNSGGGTGGTESDSGQEEEEEEEEGNEGKEQVIPEESGNGKEQVIPSDDEESGKKGVAVKSVRLNESVLKLGADDTFQLTATVVPSNAENKNVTWSSDDKDVATVSSSGKVTAKDEGTAYITVTTKDGGETAECKVIVGERDDSGGLVKKITISGDSQITVGQRKELTASVSPYNASDPGVKWKSSDTSIAVVTPTGTKENACKVEGVRNGTVTITAQAYDEGGAKATFTVKIGTGKASDSEKSSSGNSSSSNSNHQGDKGVAVKSVSIDGPTSISKGTRVEYSASVSPSNAEDTGVKWSLEKDKGILNIYKTSDENVVKVEGNKSGTDYLIATSYYDSSVYKRIKITVK